MNFRSFIGCKDVVSNLIGDLADSVGCDIVFGTETWLNDNVLNSELSLDEYHVHRRDRQDKEGGGVFLCIKKHFNSVLIHKSKHSELVFAKINIPRKAPVIVGCV